VCECKECPALSIERFVHSVLVVQTSISSVNR
jgi:hypothetical protein